MPGFPTDGDNATIRNYTIAGGVAGALAVGFGTMPFTGTTEALLGLTTGAISGLALGIGTGAIVGTALLSKPGEPGRMGMAVVGGALGGVVGGVIGTLTGAYIGHAGFNVLGFTAGGAAGAAGAYVAARLLTAGD